MTALALGEAAARLADALEGLLTTTGWIPAGDAEMASVPVGVWLARKALWDYSDAAGTGYEPYCMDDRDTPSPEAAYAAKIGDSWVKPTALNAFTGQCGALAPELALTPAAGTEA